MESDFYIGGGLENMDVVGVIDWSDRHWFKGMQIHLVYTLEMACMHKFLLSLGYVPQANCILWSAPNLILLLSTPHELGDLSIFLHLKEALWEVANIPELDNWFTSSGCEEMAVERGELYWVERCWVSFIMIDGLTMGASIPKNGLPFIIAGGKDAIVERAKTNLFYFLVVEGEISKWFYVIWLFLCVDIPEW